MIKILAIAVLVASLSLAGAPPASAQSGPTPEFLCGAKASKQRMVPGSAARRAFIQNCIATSKTSPGPAAEPRPTPPKPIPAPAPEAKPTRPTPAKK